MGTVGLTGSQKAEGRVRPLLCAQSVAAGANSREVLTSKTGNKAETDRTDSRARKTRQFRVLAGSPHARPREASRVGHKADVSGSRRPHVSLRGDGVPHQEWASETHGVPQKESEDSKAMVYLQRGRASGGH